MATDIETLSLKVDTSAIDAATGAMNALAEAAERADAALSRLNGNAHGGISVEVVGSVAQATVKPSQGQA